MFFFHPSLVPSPASDAPLSGPTPQETLLLDPTPTVLTVEDPGPLCQVVVTGVEEVDTLGSVFLLAPILPTSKRSFTLY